MEQLPVRPGDVIREKKTGIDYIVHDVVAAAGGAGIIIYAIRTYGQSVERWELDNVDWFDADFLPIWRNVKKSTPKEVQEAIERRVNDVVQSNILFYNELKNPRNKALLDLILAGGMDDGEFGTIERGILSLADALARTGDLPSEAHIIQLLREEADPGVTDEFIKDLAQRIRKVAPPISKHKSGPVATTHGSAPPQPRQPSRTNTSSTPPPPAASTKRSSGGGGSQIVGMTKKGDGPDAPKRRKVGRLQANQVLADTGVLVPDRRGRVRQEKLTPFQSYIVDTLLVNRPLVSRTDTAKREAVKKLLRNRGIVVERGASADSPPSRIMAALMAHVETPGDAGTQSTHLYRGVPSYILGNDDPLINAVSELITSTPSLAGQDPLQFSRTLLNEAYQTIEETVPVSSPLAGETYQRQTQPLRDWITMMLRSHGIIDLDEYPQDDGPLSMLIQSRIDNDIMPSLERDRTEWVDPLVKAIVDYVETDPEQSAFLTDLKSSFWEDENQDHLFPHYQRNYNRVTATSSARWKMARSIIGFDPDALLKQYRGTGPLSNGGSFAFNTDSFYSSVLMGAQVSVGEGDSMVTGRLDDIGVRRAMKEAGFGSHILMNYEDLENIIASVRRGETIDLSTLHTISQYNTAAVGGQIPIEVSQLASRVEGKVLRRPFIHNQFSIEGRIESAPDDLVYRYDDTLSRSIEELESDVRRRAVERRGEDGARYAFNREDVDTYRMQELPEDVRIPEGVNTLTERGLGERIDSAGVYPYYGHQHDHVVEVTKPRWDRDDPYESIMKAYWAGRESVKIDAVRKADGMMRLIGTETGSLSHQYGLTQRLLSNDSSVIMLDLETRTHVGNTVLEEAYSGRLIDRTRNTPNARLEDLVNWRRFRREDGEIITAPRTQAETVIGLAESMRGADVVVGQSEYDLPTLIDMAERLANELSISTDPDEIALIPKLRESIDIMSDTFSKRFLDARFIYNLAGEELGSLGQPVLSLKILGKAEKHRAKPDTADMADIIFHEDIHRRLISEMGSIDSIEGGTMRGAVIAHTNSFSPFAGNITKVLGVKDVVDASGKTSFQLVMERLDYDAATGKLNSSNSVMVHQFESPGQLGSILGGAAITSSEDEMLSVLANQDNKVAEEILRINRENSGRFLGNLNMTNRTYFDEMAAFSGFHDKEFSAEAKLGRFNTFSLAVDLEVDKLMKNQELTDGLNRSGWGHLVPGLNHTGARPLDILENAETTRAALERVVRDRLHGEGVAEHVVDAISQRYVRRMFENDPRLSPESTSANLYSRFRTTETAKRIASAVNLTREVQDFSSAEAVALTKADMLTSELLRRAADQASGVVDVDKKHEPRIRFRYQDEASNLRFLKKPVDGIAQLDNKLSEVITEALLQYTPNDKYTDPISTALKARGVFGDAQLDQIATLARRYREQHNTRGNLPEWKRAVMDLVRLERDDSQWGMLARAHDTIREAEGVNIVKEALGRNSEGLSEGAARELDEILNSITRDDVTSRLDKLKVRLTKLQTSKPDIFSEIFTESNTNLNAEKFIGWTDSQLDEAVQAVEEMWKNAGASDLERLQRMSELATTAKELNLAALVDEKPGPERSAIAGTHFWQTLHQQGAAATANNTVGGGGAQTVNMMNQHTTVARAAGGGGGGIGGGGGGIGGGIGGGGGGGSATTSTTTTATHALNANSGIHTGMRANLGRLTVPLAVMGGVIGLLAASTPSDPRFSQGNISDRAGDELSRHAEIPGDPSSSRVWSGEDAPFRLDISFRGMVQSNAQKDQLIRSVYDSISGTVQIRRNGGDIQDQRNKTHRPIASEILRENMR